MNKAILKIGSRGSKLALYQAYQVEKKIKQNFPEMATEVVIIKTKGDIILDVALSKIGDKGLFTKELEVDLHNGEIDMAVHSLKDMPTNLPEGLMLGAVLERGEINDAFVSAGKVPLKEFTASQRIATSSLRRIAALKHINPHFNIVDIRGNVLTRLQKMKEGYCDALIMAATGLRRLGLEENITEILPPEKMIPAVGQGAIGIEVRQNDGATAHILEKINHMPTWHAITAERAFMHTLQGGCQVPIGCYTIIENGQMKLTGFVASPDGVRYVGNEMEGSVDQALALGKQLAILIAGQGGNEILKEIRNS
jgi:hydroxymethylbilane synthase